jgi:hypothetical protein
MSPHHHNFLSRHEKRKFNSCKYAARKWVNNYHWVTKSGHRLHYSTSNLKQASTTLREETGWSMGTFEQLYQYHNPNYHHHRLDASQKRHIIQNSSMDVVIAQLAKLTQLEYKRHVKCARVNHRMALSPTDLFGSAFFKSTFIKAHQVTE